MSSAFRTSKPPTPKYEEPPTIVEEKPEDVQQRIRKRLPQGRQENLLYGILAALKKQLGE